MNSRPWPKVLISGLLTFLLNLSATGQTVRRSSPHAVPGQSRIDAKNLGYPADGKLRRIDSSGIEEAYLPAIQPSSHAANLVVLKNGDVLCFWFTGKAEGDSGVGIAISRLSRGSRQWTQPVLIDRKLGESYQNPVPFQAPDGTLWLLHTTQPAGQGQADARVLILWSRDNGHTWSKPKVLFDAPGSFLRNPIVLMPDGGWLLPMYYTPSKGITTGAESNYSVVKISHDQGRTWRNCPVPYSNGYVQPSVIRLADHRYVAFFRSRFADWIFKSTSSDGCHWTAPARTTLPNNNASIQAAMLRDHHIVLAFDNSSSAETNHKPKMGPRKPLAVAVSTDDGETWKWIRNVETGRHAQAFATGGNDAGEPDEYSYPSILQDHDGQIDLAFTFRRETIKFVRFRESWMQGVDDARTPLTPSLRP
ncbi:MAG TPA: sialidase family protein [Acidobacteriaceae bacterium]|nr:sialidase family protein [Acidobacteriaceae bacterium]